MKIDKIPSVPQMRLAARRRLPKAVFDFIDGGSDDEITLGRNRSDFADIGLVPRVGRDVRDRAVSATILGEPSALPLMIAPTGLASLARPGTELALARAAKTLGIPFTLSTASSCSIEDVAAVGLERRWFQLYVFKDREVTYDLVARAEAAGFESLLVTMDVPVLGKRERDVINGFTVPLSMTPRNLWEFASHAGWTVETLSAGIPTLKNFDRYASVDTANVAALSTWINRELDPGLTWSDIADLRARWRGKLLVKGVLTPQDTQAAANAGVDGVIVSNHGGRQLDGAPSAIAALRKIARETSGSMPLFIDSGIRRGSDIVKALCLGAEGVFVGRATLFGAAAGGDAGIMRTLTILQEEVDRTLALLGVDSVQTLDESYLDVAPTQS